MRCPVDGTELLMTDRQGVEIDYCPTCRGVWLDRGELDKIIERSAEELAPAPQPQPQRRATPAREYREPYPADERDRRYDPRAAHYGEPRYDKKYYKKKKRKSLLSEIFDFD